MRAKVTRSDHGQTPIPVSSVTVTLSRRNLESLLRMLDEGRKQGALTARDNHIEILVQGQENEDHYTDRDPGSMSWERGEVPDKLAFTLNGIHVMTEEDANE